MITVSEAKQIAQDWVEAEAPNISHFRGAFLAGSVIWKNDDDPLPAASDVDLKVVVDIDPDDPIFEGDLRHQNISFKGIPLEATFSPFEEFSTPEQVLADFAYAAHFSVPNIISDPSGELAKIQKAVSEQFAQKKWVAKRIEGARGYALEGLDALQSGSLADRMLNLMTALWGIVQIPLHADLRAPTGRRCVIVFLDIMKDIEKKNLHESVLDLLGSRSMSREDVERHIKDLTYTFDQVIEIAKASVNSDLANEAARPAVIDGSWEMVNDGFHREAIIWISAMRAIFQQTILRDGSEEEQALFTKQYEKLLTELGLRSEDDFQKRAVDGALLLDEVMQVAVEIVESSEKITE